jgi:gamma-glutamyltranspeptidase/glutathione hydrolase
MKRNSGPYRTIVEALKLAYADRDSYADQAFVQSPAEGLLSKDTKERAGQPTQHASKGYLAGDPLRFDSKVKSWPYWIAHLPNAAEEHEAPEEDLTAGVIKDTTHISVIDRDGNVFDSTPSGAWIPTSPILGKTGIAMSVRGESFWLDASRAAQLRPRSRPRYTLTPTIVLRNGQPFVAIGTPGGDNQEQTILQAFLNIVEFWPEWYPNLHEAFRWPRVQTMHFYGSFWPQPAGFNKLNVESDLPDAVYQELSGTRRLQIAPASIASCATAVLVDPEPATASREPIPGGTVTRWPTDVAVLPQSVIRHAEGSDHAGCANARGLAAVAGEAPRIEPWHLAPPAQAALGRRVDAL